MLAALVLLGLGIAVAVHLDGGSSVGPLRARIVAIAQGQIGYRTDPADTYCNKFSAFWDAGNDTCVAAPVNTDCVGGPGNEYC